MDKGKRAGRQSGRHKPPPTAFAYCICVANCRFNTGCDRASSSNRAARRRNSCAMSGSRQSSALRRQCAAWLKRYCRALGMVSVRICCSGPTTRYVRLGSWPLRRFCGRWGGNATLKKEAALKSAASSLTETKAASRNTQRRETVNLPIEHSGISSALWPRPLVAKRFAHRVDCGPMHARASRGARQPHVTPPYSGMSGIRHSVAGAGREWIGEPSEEVLGRRHTATLSSVFPLHAAFRR